MGDEIEYIETVTLDDDDECEEKPLKKKRTPGKNNKRKSTNDADGSTKLWRMSEYFGSRPQCRPRRCSNPDQFKEAPFLPSGWKVLETKRQSAIKKEGVRVDKEFLSPDNMVFRSKIAMEEYIKVLEMEQE